MNQIGDYEIVGTIGAGNHGTFYKARPPARLGLDAEFVAVKLLERHATDDEFRRVANELRVFAAVKSDHLVEAYDAGHQGGQLFYVVAWYPDGSLAMPTNSLEQRVVVQAVADACRGAHALHEVGVAHRDIKPSNVLLDDGRGRLSDLGLAQVMSPGMTTTGVGPVGSIEFMEPDLVWGEKAGRASDVWSLALTLHHGLVGEGVFGVIPEANVLEAFRHVIHNRPTVSPDLPAEFSPILERALAEDRKDRYATAAELAVDIEKAGELS